MFYYKYETEIGIIYIAEENEHIVKISFSEINAEEKETDIIKKAYEQLSEYLKGQRTIFDLPLALNGTEFQKQVWNALAAIPYGETRSYKDIACIVGNSKASRAIGMANNKNPIAIIIPCHRVIGKNRKLTGYAGGLSIKEKLLNAKKSTSKD